MTEHNTTSEPDRPPMLRPRRQWTILGRLSHAVREQNWFAVALEIVIVVLGVVIGFQVSAWGQARADRAQERVYLHQLESDLEETLANLAATDSLMAVREMGTTQILRAFQRTATPPRDSLLAWIDATTQWGIAQPVTETAETLVATGDLRLIRSSPLQVEIPGYVAFMAEYEGYQLRNFEEGIAGINGLRPHFDYVEAYQYGNDKGRWRGLFGETFTPPFVDGGRPPFPLEPSQFLSNRDAYTHAVLAYNAVHFMKLNRVGMRRGAEEMLRLVRSEIATRDDR